MNALRKLIAIALLAVFGLPFVPPLLAMTASAGTNLPACCRRHHGAHHCICDAMQPGAAHSDPEFSAPLERCPCCPASVGISLHGGTFLAATYSVPWPVTDLHELHVAAQSAARPSERDRARPQRGPPATSLL